MQRRNDRETYPSYSFYNLLTGTGWGKTNASFYGRAVRGKNPGKTA